MEQHVKELSPTDAGVIEESCNAARFFTRYEMPIEKPMELMGLFGMLKMIKMMRMMRAMRKYGKVSTKDYASRFSDPFLPEVFPFILDDMPGFPLMGPLTTLAGSGGHNAGWLLTGHWNSPGPMSTATSI